jgi:hypothetical protein
MSGYSREELTGTPFSDYFQDAALATAGVKETFEKGVVTDYVLTLARRTGSPLRVSFNASVFKDASGDVRGNLRFSPRHHGTVASAIPTRRGTRL